MSELDRYIDVLSRLYAAPDPAPPLLTRARAIQRVLAGEGLEDVVVDTGLSRRHLRTWAEAVDAVGLHGWLGKAEPIPERILRAKAGIGQMVLGALAEQHFEHSAATILGGQGFRIVDDRVGRTDTDYLLVDGNDRRVCRFNIKFHGTLFRESQEYVGLYPSDCFALATYKIHGALKRQDQERLPYVFLILSVPDFPRSFIEQSVPEESAWLAALSNRATEERITNYLLQEKWAEDVRQRVAISEFRVISARRADLLLRQKLFERVHALRLKSFNRTFRGAEINMHLSLSEEMIGFADFLTILAGKGVLDLTVRLDRGEI